MITEDELKTLKGFGLEKDGSYCDRWMFSIFPRNKQRTEWALYSFNEIDGEVGFLCNVKDFADLAYMYWTFSYEELEIDE